MATDRLAFEGDLMTLCATYLARTKREPTMWDLLKTMHRTLQKVDLINKNSPVKKLQFAHGTTIVDRRWLQKVGGR